jgi:hypothetical protein
MSLTRTYSWTSSGRAIPSARPSHGRRITKLLSGI